MRNCTQVGPSVELGYYCYCLIELELRLTFGSLDLSPKIIKKHYQDFIFSF